MLTELPEPGSATDVGWFVYGVTVPGLVVPDSLRGVDDQPVRLLAQGEVAAIASSALLDRPPGRRAELLAYTRVLDTLAQAGPVAPVQFGSILADRDDVVEEVLDPGLATLLEELNGRLQFNVRGVYREDVVLSEVVRGDRRIAALRELTRNQPSEAFRAERLELGRLVATVVDQVREQDAAEILDVLSGCAVAVSERPVRGLDGVLDAAVLVARDAVADLEDALEDLARRLHRRLRLQLLGPTAPYDFVGGGPWD